MWSAIHKLGVLLLLTLFLGACQTVQAENPAVQKGSERWSATQWEKVSTTAPPGLIETILQDKTNVDIPKNEPPLETAKGIVMKIQTPQENRVLYLVTLGSERLCGSGGCWYFGYLTTNQGKSYRKVLQELLDSRLPPDLKFLQVADKTSHDLPCLTVTELEDITAGDTLRNSQFCFNGQQYKRVSSLLKTVSSQDNSHQGGG